MRERHSRIYAFQSLAVGEIEYGENLLSGDDRVELEEIVDHLAAFEKVDETLNRHTRAYETGSPAHALRSHPDGFGRTALLFLSHNLSLSHVLSRCCHPGIVQSRHDDRRASGEIDGTP